MTNPSQVRSRSRRICLEPLEPRQMLAFDATLVKDLPTTGGLEASPHSLVAIEDTLYFLRTYSFDRAAELWKSDGTAQGTVKVKSFPAATSGGYASDLVNVKGTLF